jgi:hypothetical protein
MAWMPADVTAIHLVDIEHTINRFAEQRTTQQVAGNRPPTNS